MPFPSPPPPLPPPLSSSSSSFVMETNLQTSSSLSRISFADGKSFEQSVIERCFIFWRYRVQIPIRSADILMEFFSAFLIPSRKRWDR
jgi:hypothetical protein